MRLPFPRRRRGAGGEGISYQIVEVIGASEQLGEAVERAGQRIAERQRSTRSLPGVDLVGLALLGAAAGGAFVAVRTLLDRDPSSLALPGPLQGTAAGASGELRHARAAFEAGIIEGRRAREAAERELQAEYLARSGRGSQPAEADPLDR